MVQSNRRRGTLMKRKATVGIIAIIILICSIVIFRSIYIQRSYYPMGGEVTIKKGTFFFIYLSESADS